MKPWPALYMSRLFPDCPGRNVSEHSVEPEVETFSAQRRPSWHRKSPVYRSGPARLLSGPIAARLPTAITLRSGRRPAVVRTMIFRRMLFVTHSPNAFDEIAVVGIDLVPCSLCGSSSVPSTSRRSGCRLDQRAGHRQETSSRAQDRSPRPGWAPNLDTRLFPSRTSPQQRLISSATTPASPADRPKWPIAWGNYDLPRTGNELEDILLPGNSHSICQPNGFSFAFHSRVSRSEPDSVMPALLSVIFQGPLTTGDPMPDPVHLD